MGQPLQPIQSSEISPPKNVPTGETLSAGCLNHVAQFSLGIPLGI